MLSRCTAAGFYIEIDACQGLLQDGSLGAPRDKLPPWPDLALPLSHHLHAGQTGQVLWVCAKDTEDAPASPVLTKIAARRDS